jgi:hypothetical protein
VIKPTDKITIVGMPDVDLAYELNGIETTVLHFFASWIGLGFGPRHTSLGLFCLWGGRGDASDGIEQGGRGVQKGCGTGE